MFQVRDPHEFSDLPSSLNLPFVEELYEAFRRDPASVSPRWRAYFERGAANGGGHGAAAAPEPAAPAAASLTHSDVAALQDQADQLIRSYRVRGHLVAQLDPLDHAPRPAPPELDPAFYGFSEADLDRRFSSRSLAGAPDRMTLREMLEIQRSTYCRSIGVQYMHIDDLGMKRWLQERMEGTRNRTALSREDQLHTLTRLTDAVIFEEFIQKKYVGAKRFSLEGAESLIPLLDLAIETAAEQGVVEVVMGMAHRGRINVLWNLVGKSARDIFREFDDTDAERFIGRGDVKYHMGHSGDRTTRGGRRVHLSLCFNPSHLEFVNPVALGRMRAKQDLFGDPGRERGLVILMHGDAAFIGQGVVQETLNMSQLPGYSVGGTLHVIVNNQIGFTTGPEEARSSPYASDVARMLQVPVFHVNGEDPEAVAHVVRLALDFRRRFRRDVVLNMYCYRRHGHNEGDEPSFTQPLMAGRIRARKPVRESYLARILTMGAVSREEADRIAVERREALERELSAARSADYIRHEDTLGGAWAGYTGGPEPRNVPVPTGVPRERLAELLEATSRVPAGFRLHPKLIRWTEARREMAAGRRPLDWAAAEALALASLAVEGTRVRLTGQDSARGTFSQRHASLHDTETGERWTPLEHLAPGQGTVEIVNSPLSEVGVMGFEYGYSMDSPAALVMWEAQFGDFCNVAQVIIDQFIVSAEEKWRRLSGLTLLLPHGFEGQGPEHSSARIERFLSLSAEDNIQVANPSTPAQYFHLLRRQVRRPWRKPLVVMTPKSLLRHPDVVSPLEALEEGEFRCVLPDDRFPAAGGAAPPGAAAVGRILLCSGKVYYDLRRAREELGRRDVAIVRLEQLFPLREEELARALAPFGETAKVTWVQEEPENMGAWPSLRLRFGDRMAGRPLLRAARRASPSPATGSHGSHELEQAGLLDRAFNA